jgi:MoxR-like ATPase
LTVLPKLVDGLISYDDSPLVKAVKFGRVLVVDEVDKAAPEILFVLKTLSENQDIYLGDGRRIISSESSNIIQKNENDIFFTTEIDPNY